MMKPMNLLHTLMMSSVVLIFLTLLTIQYVVPAENSIADLDIDYTKVNLPGPKSSLSTEDQAMEIPDTDGGKIIFLKEDLQEEEFSSAPVELTSYTETILTEDEIFMNELTRSEPLKSIDGADKYLIIAGTYTNDMILLSKQAQYTNKGYTAEIIQFENAPEKNICIGRFSDRNAANTVANEVEEKHDISTFVFHQIASK